MKPLSLRETHGLLAYDTEKATLLAGDDWWDGHNYERRGRNRFLYRSPAGRYFLQHRTAWQGEQARLEPITEAEALFLYSEELTERRVGFEVAFPTQTVQEA